MHAYEIEYVFGVPIYNSTAGYTNRERILSSKIIQYWSTFANNGFVLQIFTSIKGVQIFLFKKNLIIFCIVTIDLFYYC